MRNALRSLYSRSGLVCGAVAILVVAIGMATTMVALSDPHLSRPLPFGDADRLITINVDVGLNAAVDRVPALSDWASRADLFAGIAAIGRNTAFRIRLEDHILPLQTVAVTPNLLTVLGVQAEGTGAETVAGNLWVSRKAQAKSGGGLSLGNTVQYVPTGVLRVVGVLPTPFLLPDPSRPEAPDALVTMAPGLIATVERSQSRMSVDVPRLVARMKPGVTPAFVKAALNASLARTDINVEVLALNTTMKTRFHRLAQGAVIASGLVLIVCWANVATIALTRGLYRRRELAIRTILGATNRRLVRLFLVEGAIVAIAATSGGLLLATFGLPAIVAVMPASFAELGVPSVTGHVVLFATAAGVVGLVAWFVGSLAAWLSSARTSSSARAAVDGRGLRTIRLALLSGQLTLAVVLLTAAVLLGRSYGNLLNVDSGLDGTSLALTVSYVEEATPARLEDVLTKTLAALRAASSRGVVAASVGSLVDGLHGAALVSVEGSPVLVDRTEVTSDYFAATGMQFMAGRPIGPDDDPQAVAVINQRMADRAFADGEAVGKALRLGSSVRRVVGVVKDSRRDGLAQSARPSVFLRLQGPPSHRITYIINTSAPDRDASRDWQRVIQGVEPTAVVLDQTLLQERLNRSIRDRSFATSVVGLFAFSTTIVATVGLVGVVGYAVARRTREIGIRLALGSSQGAVVWLVMREALRATLVGCIAGFGISRWLSKTLESLLYEVSPADIGMLLLTALGLFVIALLAAWSAGRGARRLHPLEALRTD